MPDSAQEQAVGHTQRVYDALGLGHGSTQSLLRWLRTRIAGPPSVKELYLWGEVDRGKTY
ncbi:MAG: hypothetical protein ACREXW_16335 [Gammaproteobacteria bacterium]